MRHQWSILLVLCLSGLVRAEGPQTHPVTTRGVNEDDITTPQQLAAVKAQLIAQDKADFDALQPLRANSLADVLGFAIVENDLTLSTKLPRTDGYVRLEVPGLPGLAKVHVLAIPANNESTVGGAFSFVHQDRTPVDALLVSTSVFRAPQQMNISRAEERLDVIRDVQLIQSENYVESGQGKIKLYVTVTQKNADKPLVKLELSAANIVELRRKYPRETALYVEPIFAELGQEQVLTCVDPKLAWEVLGSLYEPPADVRAKVAALVAKMNADNFAQRESASTELTRMGAPAAMVLARLDRSKLSDEQKTRIDAIVAAFKPIAEEESARLRKDIYFLLDCLASDDASIRSLAARQLSSTVGRQIAFDPALTGAAHRAAVARVRHSVLGPATQPVQSP